MTQDRSKPERFEPDWMLPLIDRWPGLHCRYPQQLSGFRLPAHRFRPSARYGYVSGYACGYLLTIWDHLGLITYGCMADAEDPSHRDDVPFEITLIGDR